MHDVKLVKPRTIGNTHYLAASVATIFLVNKSGRLPFFINPNSFVGGSYTYAEAPDVVRCSII